MSQTTSRPYSLPPPFPLPTDINNMSNLQAWFYGQTHYGTSPRSPQNVLSDINEARQNAGLSPLTINNNSCLLYTSPSPRD